MQDINSLNVTVLLIFELIHFIEVNHRMSLDSKFPFLLFPEIENEKRISILYLVVGFDTGEMNLLWFLTKFIQLLQGKCEIYQLTYV